MWATRRGLWIYKQSDPDRRLWLCEPGSTTPRATGAILPEGTVELSFAPSGERALATRLDRVDGEEAPVDGPEPIALVEDQDDLVVLDLNIVDL